MRRHGVMVLDIETRADPDAIKRMPAPKVKAPANYKDADKIAAYIEAKTAEKTADIAAKAALDPDLATVSSIGIMPVDGLPEVFIGASEPQRIEEAWQRLSTAQFIVGYNVLAFDYPFLIRRSMEYGIRPVLRDLRKFQAPPRASIVDLMQIMFNWGGRRFKGLATVADLMQLDNRPIHSGADMEDMTLDDEIEHLTADLRTTAELFRAMDGYYWTKIMQNET